MLKKKNTKFDHYYYLLIDKKLYTINHSLTYNEIFNFFFPLSKISIVEYNNKLTNSSNVTKKTCQNNFFIKNFDKIELVTVIGGG